MKSEPELHEALRLLQSNKAAEGQRVLEELLLESPNNIKAHELLVQLAFNKKDLSLAEKHLALLHKIAPTLEKYITPLIEVYCHQSRWLEVASLYLKQASFQKNTPTLLFNYAYYMKLAGKFDIAIEYYSKVLDLGIRDEYEVFLNIANIYSENLSEPDQAIEILNKAIEKYPNQDSLLYNLANIYEQLGNKKQALASFQAAFSKNPKNFDALARQADIHQVKDKSEHLIIQMTEAYHCDIISDNAKINIAYALGKSHDDCGEYDLAFQFYQQANTLDQKTLPSYKPQKYEEYINNIISTFTKAWMNSFKLSNAKEINEPPIFICGMFRSGSTLCEQILSGHSKISIGGEQEYFQRTIANSNKNFPNEFIDHLSSNKTILLEEYLAEINKFRKNGAQLTDKRPDNFLYLGVIKALMPRAKIVWTTRALLDNCLSVFFLRLGASMSYATKLEHTIHFYQQQVKLMKHWQTIFGEDIYQFNYDELIKEPKNTVEALLSFLGLPWENNCLNFHEVENHVKTASVWQVRQPLYTKSSGRWMNYHQQLKKLALV